MYLIWFAFVRVAGKQGEREKERERERERIFDITIKMKIEHIQAQGFT